LKAVRHVGVRALALVLADLLGDGKCFDDDKDGRGRELLRDEIILLRRRRLSFSRRSNRR
jgi:hypothetical protein